MAHARRDNLILSLGLCSSKSRISRLLRWQTGRTARRNARLGKRRVAEEVPQENHLLMQLYGLDWSFLRYDRLTLNQPNIH